MKRDDGIVASTLVAVDAATAFAVFTDEVDLWWKRGPRYRVNPGRDSAMRFEPGVGGRLLEVYDDDATDAFELGRVSIWEPPRRLVFEMGGRDFGPGESTEVEVTFDGLEDGTRVTVVHRGFGRLPPDHPVRHGMPEPAFGNMMGVWWGDLLVVLQALAARRAS